MFIFLLQSGPIVYAWDSLIMDKNLMEQRDQTGRLIFQNKQVENLEPDTAYVAKIKVCLNGAYFYVLFF